MIRHRRAPLNVFLIVVFHQPNHVDIPAPQLPIQIKPVSRGPFPDVIVSMRTERDAPVHRPMIVDLDLWPLRFAGNTDEFRPNLYPRPAASLAKLNVVGIIWIYRPFGTVDDSTAQQFEHLPVAPLGVEVELDRPFCNPCPRDHVAKA